MPSTVLNRLGLLIWRLIPANPILVRVVYGASRRVRHLWIRFAYLVFLLLVTLFFVVSGPGSGGASLADLAKNASSMFKIASIAQLALMCFLSPVFAAGAITQERDAQTFNILLATPLSNAQIVLGSLMSRLYFVLMLLLSGLPIFLIMMIYGGITFGQIVESFAIAAATAIITGSLAICVSMIRVGTRRTILSFYVAIGFYLISVYALGKWDGTWMAEAPPGIDERQLSWLAPIHPFLALDVALNRVSAPDIDVLGGRSGLTKFVMAYPHRAYVFITLLASALMTLLAMFFVRQPKEGEPGIWASLVAKVSRGAVGERSRKPRHVWNNPVAWREATFRASAATRGFLNFALLGGGLVTAIVLVVNHMQTGDVSETREWLSAVVTTELFLILLAATNTAATAMTKDKESAAMDLLLTTPLTSRYIVWGKFRGLVTFTIPLIAIPTLTVLLLGIQGLFSKDATPVVPIEATVEIAVLMTAYSAAACMFGLTVSLHSRRTIKAVMVSVGIVIIVCLILTLVADSICKGNGVGGAFAAPFTPFTAIRVLTSPEMLFDAVSDLNAQFDRMRVSLAVGSAVAVVIYVAAVAAGYRSVVRNFDMVMRKQSGLM